MITITKSAQDHFIKLLKNQIPGTQIRVFVINPGTPFAECGVSYCAPDSIEESDIELKFDKLSAYIDSVSAPFLENAEINFSIDKLGSQLTIKAPNAKIKYVNSDAPLIERINYVIKSQINPQLAIHGGSVSLIKITNDGYVILQFSGGCNGCSMVSLTLKNGIEKQLLNMFPNELNGVKDFTEHQHGEHSFY
ncbi:Fe/S biogenesis protein NfuA [Candidatus Arsenophonus lipoptenae]|uniref:Fe/S biogenesis protein NfuA n=1 Tax=Candidatus Arsenophonus lipoptenae TaxID=634113 RepID=A0A0X9VSA9_9GAMM|nr:Fe-S biogenesis protein NfuA [Candidatus Arsenophonus lipoptenae]AMA64922.1 Fe/S biogenesis protein NfuA [Candidatus Arsenophonus lipoptenae]